GDEILSKFGKRRERGRRRPVGGGISLGRGHVVRGSILRSRSHPATTCASDERTRPCLRGERHAAINDGHPRLNVSRKMQTMGSARNNAKTRRKSDAPHVSPPLTAAPHAHSVSRGHLMIEQITCRGI